MGIVARLLWTICQLLIIQIRITSNPNMVLMDRYMGFVDRIDDGLKRIDRDIHDELGA